MSIKEQIIRASKDQLGSLEKKLNGLMTPVAPRQEFINSLRDRIHITQSPAIISRFNNIQFVFLMLLSIISGVVVVTMVARALFSLLSLRKNTTNFL